MKERMKLLVVAAVLLLFAGGCAVTDFDRSVDFHEYKTYAWGKSQVEVENPVYESDLINKNIRTTVERELARRGIFKDAADPDFVISYHTYTEQKEKTTHTGPYGAYPYFPYAVFPYTFGWGWGFPLGWYGGGMPRTETVTEGTLIVDIKDNNTDELIWRGTVNGNVDNVKNLQRQIQKGIRAIMKKYPVSPDQPLTIPGRDVIS